MALDCQLAPVQHGAPGPREGTPGSSRGVAGESDQALGRGEKQCRNEGVQMAQWG